MSDYVCVNGICVCMCVRYGDGGGGARMSMMCC